jgi:AcrR family transcriptional regulator
MARHKLISDEDLLKIAREVFIEHGSKVSAQVIADKVGISQAALFKRFGTKEEMIIKAMAPDEILPIIEWINERPQKDEPIENQISELLYKIDEMLDEILPQIEVLRESRIPRGKIWGHYRRPPPTRIVEAIGQFFDRAKAEGKLTDRFSSTFIAKMIFGTLVGQRNMNALGKNEGEVPFIESLNKTICLCTLKKSQSRKKQGKLK